MCSSDLPKEFVSTYKLFRHHFLSENAGAIIECLDLWNTKNDGHHILTKPTTLDIDVIGSRGHPLQCSLRVGTEYLLVPWLF